MKRFDHPSYKIKSVKHDSYDRVKITFKDGRDFYLYPDEIEMDGERGLVCKGGYVIA